MGLIKLRLEIDENCNDMLYRYIEPEVFEKEYGKPHPDPMIDEFTYGEGYYYSKSIWKNVNVGSRIFFHTKRCINAMYYINNLAPASVWRLDEKMKNKYKNPHLHPELYPEWWGREYDVEDQQDDIEVKIAYENGTYLRRDVVLIGDPEKSVDIRHNPLFLNRDLLSKLDMRGKPVKWDVISKHGKKLSDERIISSSLRTPRFISKHDGDILEILVKDHASRKPDMPVTKKSVRRKPSENIEPSAHEEIQYLLLNLGSYMGLKVWVARNDRNKSVNGKKFTEIPRLQKKLPIYFDPEIVNKIELIDVLWLERNAIIAAFEIESTTSIYSGLLRMSNLIHTLPNLKIPIYLVAPEERREKVMVEVNQPAFSQISLSENCRYISFTNLKQAIDQFNPEMLPYLRPQILEHWSEPCDQYDDQRD
jgi:hypothetical protein